MKLTISEVERRFFATPIHCNCQSVSGYYYAGRLCTACYWDGVELLWDIIRVVLPLAAAAQQARALP